MIKKFTKEELISISDINFAIFIIESQVSKCWVLLSYKRKKLTKTIETLQKIKEELEIKGSDLLKLSWL